MIFIDFITAAFYADITTTCEAQHHKLDAAFHCRRSGVD